MKTQLTGKSVLITGGSAGLVFAVLFIANVKGAECARKFAEEGEFPCFPISLETYYQ
jgi:hypothetical protein